MELSVQFNFWFALTHTHTHKVGNAVPPPMAKAIGLQIKKSIVEKKKGPDSSNNTSSNTH